MEAEIRTSGDQDSGIDEIGEFADLLEWLRGERGLAEAVRKVQARQALASSAGRSRFW